MRSAIAVSLTVRRGRRPVRGCLFRIAFGTFAVAGLLTVTARPTAAQTRPEPRRTWELVVPTGTVIPTGTLRDVVKRGGLAAVQLAYVVDPSLALVATAGWARSRDLASEGDPKLDLFTYDVGAEVRAPGWLSRGMFSFSPFAGGGAGGRSYDRRSLDVDTTHNPAAYGSVGGVVGVGRVRLRVEVRDYVTGFQPLNSGGTTDSRNDVALMFGLRLGAR